ncbi:demethylmenaquinone methyltransferase [Frankia tisae]|uniref:demethylmenaquinone methyltransferase n=1 Tax=Frankia tisae TaxID=2950104 RepID=UPI0021BDFE39|nr:demethylmenaquinone methyltransferase [Frankia tisae]
MSRAGLDKRPQEVAAMFDGVAGRYDLTNAVLSGGLDRTWRRATAAALDLRPGLRVLDLAAGTATSSRAFAEAGADVVACDFSLGMLRAGQRRLAEKPLPANPASPASGPCAPAAAAPGAVASGAGRVVLTAGDGLHLPFPGAVFDRTTISFGLRNVADTVRCLSELRRVTRPGGSLVVCEFSRPVWGPWRTVYLEYLMRALPKVARTVSSSPDSYVYLAESIRAWPAQAVLADLLREAGWSRVTWRNLTGGVVALHRGHVPD